MRWKKSGERAKIKVWRANDTKNINYGTSMNKLHIIYIYIIIYIYVYKDDKDMPPTLNQ